MLDSEDLQSYQSDTVYNTQYHIINNPDKDIDKMIEANENGLFGLTHGEIINSWRDFLDNLSVFDPDYDDEEDFISGKYDLHQEVYNKIIVEIEECENWHYKNDSIHKEI